MERKRKKKRKLKEGKDRSERYEGGRYRCRSSKEWKKKQRHIWKENEKGKRKLKGGKEISEGGKCKCRSSK